jgi:hypothetical protein
VKGPGKSLNSSTWHSGEGAGVGGGRREFEPGQEQGINGAEVCRAVAKRRRAAACVVRIRGWCARVTGRFQLLVVDGLGGCPMSLSLARKAGDVPVV